MRNGALPSAVPALPTPFFRPTDQLGRDRLEVVADRSRPVTLARDQSLPVSGAVTALLPSGLRRGSTLTVEGVGARLFGFAMIAAASAAGSWVALVGGDDVNLMAAHEVGVALERVVLVDPPAEQWPATVAAAIGAFDILVLAPHHRLRAGDVRRLMARARERGSVLLALTGRWPERADATLTVSTQRWDGLGRGHGCLRSRQLRVEVTGRRELSRPRHCDLWLPDERTAA